MRDRQRCSKSLAMTNPLLQGFSTGLPERLQLALLHSLPGLESCKMLRPAYAGAIWLLVLQHS